MRILFLCLCFYLNLQPCFLIEGNLNTSFLGKSLDLGCINLQSNQAVNMKPFLLETSSINLFRSLNPQTQQPTDIFCKLLLSLPNTTKHLFLRKSQQAPNVFFLEIHKYDKDDVENTPLDETSAPDFETKKIIVFETALPDYNEFYNEFYNGLHKAIMEMIYSDIINKLINSCWGALKEDLSVQNYANSLPNSFNLKPIFIYAFYCLKNF